MLQALLEERFGLVVKKDAKEFPVYALTRGSAEPKMKEAAGPAGACQQNVQVSAGQLGAEPSPKTTDFLVSINVQGRLRTEKEFGSIILKGGDDGQVVRLSDVARLEQWSRGHLARAAAPSMKAEAGLRVCPRCGRPEHTTRVETLACIEINGGQYRDSTRAERGRLRMSQDATYLAALASIVRRVRQTS